MAELLVRTVDRVNTDHPYLDVKLTKRGDVIDVRGDGWPWQEGDKTEPYWRILRWPGMTVEQVEHLLEPEIHPEPIPLPHLQFPMLQARQYFLDFDKPDLPVDFCSYIADDTRAQPFFDMPETLSIEDLKAIRLPRPNLAEIG